MQTLSSVTASSSSSYFTVERAAKTLYRMSPCTPVSFPAKITWLFWLAFQDTNMSHKIYPDHAIHLLVLGHGFLQRGLFNTQATITQCDLSATILFKLVHSYLVAFICTITQHQHKRIGALNRTVQLQPYSMNAFMFYYTLNVKMT